MSGEPDKVGLIQQIEDGLYVLIQGGGGDAATMRKRAEEMVECLLARSDIIQLGGNGPGKPEDWPGASDLAVAIGEHAFKAGFDVAWEMAGYGDLEANRERAWSAYDPPEELKGTTL